MVRELTKQFTNFGYTTTGKQEPENVHTVKIRIANVQLQNISGFILDTFKGGKRNSEYLSRQRPSYV